MNYRRLKKRMGLIALMCVLAFLMLVGNVVPANAQGYQQYVYPYPYVYYPYSYQPYGYQPQGMYPVVDYYPYRAYPYGYYPYGYYHHHHHWHHGGHHIRRAIDWLF